MNRYKRLNKCKCGCNEFKIVAVTEYYVSYDFYRNVYSKEQIKVVMRCTICNTPHLLELDDAKVIVSSDCKTALLDFESKIKLEEYEGDVYD